MKEKVSSTLLVLREIRDEVRETRYEIKGTNERLDKVEERVKSVEQRQTQSEIRIATELVGVAHAVNEVRDLLRDRLDDRSKVEDHERRIAVLERKIG